MRIINWNTEWATSRSYRGKEIKKRINVYNPDIVCLTETYSDFLAETGYGIESSADYGYKTHPGRRKVVMWSRNPWDQVDTTGNNVLPGGRYVSGQTMAGGTRLHITGVCVPWKDAHVRTGRKDRQPWQDHRDYLMGLKVSVVQPGYRNTHDSCW